MADVHPEYARGFRHAATQILNALDEHTLAARNGTGCDEIFAEDLMRMVASGHPQSELNPLPLAVKDMSETLREIRKRCAALADGDEVRIEQRTTLTLPWTPVPEQAGPAEGDGPEGAASGQNGDSRDA